MAELDPAQIALLEDHFNRTRVYDPTEGTDLAWDQAIRRELQGEDWKQLTWLGNDPDPQDVEDTVSDWIANGCSFPTPDPEV